MRVLHISDLHFGTFVDKDTGKLKYAHVFTTAGKIDPRGLYSILIADPELTDPPDLVVISGDIAWSGTPEDYAYATEFVKLLRKAWPKSHFVITPGNHDVDQDVVVSRQLRWLLPG